MLDQWRIAHNIAVPKTAAGGRVRDAGWLAKTTLPGPGKLAFTPASSAATVYGQDSVVASYTLAGYTFYAGYVNGYVSYGAMAALHPSAKVLSITVRSGVYAVNVIDIEPGCCTVADAPGFVARSSHPGMAKPVVYCAAWQGQEVVNELSASGYARDEYVIWSAHYAGYTHICGPGTCGYAQADMTQYASNSRYDSDIALASVFGSAPPPVPTSYPVSAGATGPLVKALQNGLNKWASRTGSAVLTPDSDFGADTTAATVKAQQYFMQHGVAAGTATQWLMDQLAYPLWPLSNGRSGVDVLHLEQNLNRWSQVTGSAQQAQDGLYGSGVEGAVAKAQFHFGERGVTAGDCTQAVYDDLEAAAPPVPTSYPVVEGDYGSLVLALQNGLNKWVTRTGSASLTPDGDFGADTKTAVVKAQEFFQQHGVPAGEATQWLMDQLAFALWPVESGRQGLDVQHLQENLNKWKAQVKSAELAPDGVFGVNTAGAVAQAQVYFGERGVTAGTCTQNVYDKLEGTPPS